MVIEFPSKIDAAWLDGAIVRSLEGQGDSMTLRLRGWEDMQIFAEGRLLQWMRQLAQMKKALVVDLGIELPSVEEDPHHGLWRFLRERLGAMLLIDGAGAVRDGTGLDRRDEIKEVQGAVLRSEGGEVGFGRERALLRRDVLGAPQPFGDLVVEEVAFRYLEGRIDKMMTALGINSGNFLKDLTEFAYEIVVNTHMHACDDLDGSPIDGVRFLQIRRLRVNRQRGMEQLPTGDGPPQAFLQRLADIAVMDEGAEKTFIELTVADSGVGIPARLRGSVDVYRGAIAQEEEETLKAILTSASSRPSAAMGGGLGLDTALNMAHLLHGLVAIRTGRLELIRDTTLPTPGGDEWQVTEGPFLPGTSVSLLFPWWKDGQTKVDQATR